MSDVIITPPAVKRCTKCGVTKPVSEFSKDASHNDGMRSHCKDCVSAHMADYYVAHKQERSAYWVAYYASHKQENAARIAAYYASHKQEAAAYRTAYYMSHKQEFATYVTAWRRDNPVRARVISRNRRARKRNATGSHTAQQILDLLEKQRGKCALCKKDIRKKYHVDHIVPLLNGGSNDISNIQLLCPECNLKKGATDPIEFAQRRGLLL